jgi:hypothetical protein
MGLHPNNVHLKEERLLLAIVLSLASGCVYCQYSSCLRSPWLPAMSTEGDGNLGWRGARLQGSVSSCLPLFPTGVPCSQSGRSHDLVCKWLVSRRTGFPDYLEFLCGSHAPWRRAGLPLGMKCLGLERGGFWRKVVKCDCLSPSACHFPVQSQATCHGGPRSSGLVPASHMSPWPPPHPHTQLHSRPGPWQRSFLTFSTVLSGIP